MNVIPIIPDADAVQDAWDDYVALVRERDAAPELASDMEHAMRTVRAHERWKRLFLAADRRVSC
ncbi:hypothetical protein [Stakelama pacifica]|uniref:Uncharacterized protein n=1 Tax=Stakelama pacifica TaxID=517720 RepID=A0A4R6FJV9_9SPHN|nr:hypothetical protein [Stakelama pacifica]TDN81759.1 hypothetical protein EV664_107161 [Stakelama pacifica]GGO96487.1 hypothetical protein GCM10011329_23130 [Stakelama pacifica]